MCPFGFIRTILPSTGHALYLAHASDVAYHRSPAAGARERLGLTTVAFRNKVTRMRGFMGVCETHAVLAFRGTARRHPGTRHCDPFTLIWEMEAGAPAMARPPARAVRAAITSPCVTTTTVRPGCRRASSAISLAA